MRVQQIINNGGGVRQAGAGGDRGEVGGGRTIRYHHIR